VRNRLLVTGSPESLADMVNGGDMGSSWSPQGGHTAPGRYGRTVN